jgi:pSer/pThr/pTyr-binding forkhead associated (FHA) protein
MASAPELVVLTEDGRERRQPLGGGEVFLGREPTNQIVVDDSYLSRRHCRVIMRGDKVSISDLKSYNGTYVNGQKIHEECYLLPGDVVRIGRTRIFVDWGEEGEASSNAKAEPLRVHAPDLKPKDGVKPQVKPKAPSLAPAYKEIDLERLLAEPPPGKPKTRTSDDRSETKTPVPVSAGPEASAVARASGSSVVKKGQVPGSTTSRDREGLRIIAQIARVLPSVDDEAEFIEYTVGKLLEVIPAERAIVMRLDPNRRGLYAECVKNALPGRDDQAARRLGISHTIAKKVVRERVSVLVDDAVLDERFKEASSIQELQVRSILAAPIWIDDTVSGLVYLDHIMNAYAFTEADRELLVAVANLLALGLKKRQQKGAGGGA